MLSTGRERSASTRWGLPVQKTHSFSTLIDVIGSFHSWSSRRSSNHAVKNCKSMCMSRFGFETLLCACHPIGDAKSLAALARPCQM